MKESFGFWMSYIKECLEPAPCLHFSRNANGSKRKVRGENLLRLKGANINMNEELLAQLALHFETDFLKQYS